MIRTFALGLLLLVGTASAAAAAPVLRAEVTVTSPIVTAGDMFEGAGALAEQPMFRAPAPGTTGIVPVDAVRRAAALVGLTSFEADDVLRVRVTRAAAVVGENTLTGLIESDLAGRGIIGRGVTAVTTFDQTGLSFSAESVPEPVRLTALRYLPASGAFAARFVLAGIDQPVDVTGHVELMVDAPYLVTSKRAGEVIGPADVELRPVPLRYAESGGYAELDQLLGKALVRQTRGGVPLKLSDVAEPELVSRNEPVTIFYRNGPLTLSVKGQALGGAAIGESIQVLNLMSRKVLMAVVTGTGTVEVVTVPTTVADL